MGTTTKHNSHIGFTSILGRFKGIFVLLLMLLSTLTAGAETVTLTSSTGQVTLNDGDVVTGTGGVETRIQVAAGATVTLSLQCKRRDSLG